MEVKSVASAVAAWLAEGQRVAVANPVEFAGFSSRRPSEMLAVSELDNGPPDSAALTSATGLPSTTVDQKPPGRAPAS